jgi:putative transport protein
MSWLATSLQNHPEIALFLVLGVGHAVARLRIGSFKLNAVVCVILTGVAVGQLGIKPPPEAVQWSFFALFLFAVGYETGPQFFGGLGRSALPQIGLSVLFCAVGLASAYFLAKFFGFNAGGAAGLIAGGLGASAAIGTAGDEIAKLPVTDVFVVGLRTSGVPYLLKLHPGIVLGVCAGAGTSQSGLAAVQEAAESQVPTLGYGVSYAIGNIVLALCGSLIVAMVGAPVH